MTVSINSKAPLRRHGDVVSEVGVEMELGPLTGQPLDAADDPAEVAAKKQRLADPSSPIDPKDV